MADATLKDVRDFFGKLDGSPLHADGSPYTDDDGKSLTGLKGFAAEIQALDPAAKAELYAMVGEAIGK